jgi:hypothetical protein
MGNVIYLLLTVTRNCMRTTKYCKSTVLEQIRVSHGYFQKLYSVHGEKGQDSYKLWAWGYSMEWAQFDLRNYPKFYLVELSDITKNHFQDNLMPNQDSKHRSVEY